MHSCYIYIIKGNKEDMAIFYDAEDSFPWFHPQIYHMTHQQTFKHTSCSYIYRLSSGLNELIDMHDLCPGIQEFLLVFQKV